MSAENKAIARRLYEEVWNKRRLELVDEIISPSHALHDPNALGSAIGPEAYKRVVARFISGFPDLRFSIEDAVAENEKMVVAWTISGTHEGEFMGIPATHKKRSEEHTSELQSRLHLVCRLLLEKKKRTFQVGNDCKLTDHVTQRL